MTLKLLLVGRETSAFQLIKSAYDNEDADIIVATSIGLALFLARKNSPNLIISQQELADSDALNFFLELKSEQELAEIPFVLLINEEAAAMEAAKRSRISSELLQHKIQSINLNNEDCLSSDNSLLKKRISKLASPEKI